MFLSNTFKMVYISPWPLLFTLNLWSLIMILIEKMSFNYSGVFMYSFFMFMAVLMFWIKNVNKENLLGMVLTSSEFFKCLTKWVIMSEFFFFMSMFYSNFSITLFMNYSSNLMYGFLPINISVAFINLLVLLTSSITFMVQVKIGNLNSNKWIFNTLLLSLYFILIQNVEYKTMMFNISNSMQVSNFFTLTMFHMTHVLVGMLMMILIILLKSSLSSLSLMVKLVCWYWHFVDMIWVLIFLLIYCFININ